MLPGAMITIQRNVLFRTILLRLKWRSGNLRRTPTRALASFLVETVPRPIQFYSLEDLDPSQVILEIVIAGLQRFQSLKFEAAKFAAMNLMIVLSALRLQ